jgi:hypothetical protein
MFTKEKNAINNEKKNSDSVLPGQPEGYDVYLGLH